MVILGIEGLVVKNCEYGYSNKFKANIEHDFHLLAFISAVLGLGVLKELEVLSKCLFRSDLHSEYYP